MDRPLNLPLPTSPKYFRYEDSEADNAVPVINVAEISPDEFYASYIEANRPVVIEGLMQGWPLWNKWSIDFFRTQLGSQECEVFLEKRHRKGKKLNTTLGEYIASFPVRHLALLLLSTNTLLTLEEIKAKATATGGVLPYLRAWYFREDHPELLEDFDEHSREYFPDMFKRVSEPMFQPPFTWIFIGPAGSLTPLHCDIWYTDAWLAQIEGRKQFRFWTPEDSQYVQKGDQFVDLTEPDMEQFPDCLKPTPLSHTLEPGQVIFIPSKWAHEVKSLDDTLSVTTNFLPKCQLPVVSKSYMQWFSKQEKTRHMMQMVRELKEGKAKMKAEQEAKIKAEEVMPMS